jgi:hypothetical protein
MNDGNLVFYHLCEMAKADPELRRAIIRHEYQMPPKLLEIARGKAQSEPLLF